MDKAQREEIQRRTQQYLDRPEIEAEREIVEELHEICGRDLLPFSASQLSALMFGLVQSDTAREAFLVELADRYARFWGGEEGPNEGTDEQAQRLAERLLAPFDGDWRH